MSAPAWTRDVLDFWFGAGEPVPRDEWFRADPAFDRKVRERFLPLWRRAVSGELDAEAGDARGGLALIVLLDQFPRNMFRGTAEAFASDAEALERARAMVARGSDLELHPLERAFVYLPFEHSENLEDQEHSVRLFGRLGPEPYYREMLEYAHRHRDIIARFGRFPHRNALLGRESTTEEAAFLQTPGSSF